MGFHEAAIRQENLGPGRGEPFPARQLPRKGTQGPGPGIRSRRPGQGDEKAPVQGPVLKDGLQKFTHGDYPGEGSGDEARVCQ